MPVCIIGSGSGEVTVDIKLSAGVLFGEGLKSRQMGGFRLSERLYPPRFETPRHSHGTALLCFVIDGNYSESYEANTRSCHPLNLMFHPPHETHAQRFDDLGGRSLIVEIEPKWFSRLRDYQPVGQTPGAYRGGVFTALGARLYREFLATDNLSPLIVEGLVLQILGEAPRQAPPIRTPRVPPWLRQVKEVIRNRFSERLKQEDLARAVGVHPVHMAQTFHRQYGCTIGEYIRQLRIDFACHRLTTTNAPLAEVALAAGFCDQSHFTRTFRRLVGLPPSQFRRSRR